MNESVGYTVTINIIITFITIIFVFLSNVLIYYKSNKINKLITDSIEKHNGFNSFSKKEINIKLESVGYNRERINCDSVPSGCKNESTESAKANGYCVYYCENTKDSNYFSYKIKTNMMINIPVINNVLNLYVFSSTGNLYNFRGVAKPAEVTS